MSVIIAYFDFTEANFMFGRHYYPYSRVCKQKRKFYISPKAKEA